MARSLTTSERWRVRILHVHRGYGCMTMLLPLPYTSISAFVDTIFSQKKRSSSNSIIDHCFAALPTCCERRKYLIHHLSSGCSLSQQLLARGNKRLHCNDYCLFLSVIFITFPPFNVLILRDLCGTIFSFLPSNH
jgi:hypothetical protein